MKLKKAYFEKRHLRWLAPLLNIPEESHYENWDGLRGIQPESVLDTGWLEPSYTPRFRHRARRWNRRVQDRG